MEEVLKEKEMTNEILQSPGACGNQNQGCEWKGITDELESHEMACDYANLLCAFCQITVARKDLEKHFYLCHVTKEGMGCVYKGCVFKAARVDLLQKHYKEEAAYHALLHYMLERKGEEKLELDHLVLHEKFLIKDQSADPDSNKSIEEISCAVKDIEKELADLNLQQQLFCNSSYNGKLLWKIDGLANRSQQAKTGTVVALHSAPVYTERYGYKFCGRLYLNGDGLGKCTHVSIFIIVMKSEYDSLLQWPFHKQVTVGLLNQEDRSKDTFESFETDPSSSSFTKPVKSMNIAAGCPCFIKQENVLTDGYVKDDSIFIQITVSDI